MRGLATRRLADPLLDDAEELGGRARRQDRSPGHRPRDARHERPRARRAPRSLRPKMRVLYTSGYMDDARVRHGIEGATVAFLAKPYAPALLTERIRKVLDGA